MKFIKEETRMISKEQKEQIIAEYGRSEGDTGSPEVQVAILTARIISEEDRHREISFTDRETWIEKVILFIRDGVFLKIPRP